ncbi:MAG: lamin tail domain-containing protein [Verrucomicrobiales bacterium]
MNLNRPLWVALSWAAAAAYCQTAGAYTLRIDFNATAITQAGWEALGEGDSDLGSPWSKSFGGGLTLSLAPAGAAFLDTRDRGATSGGGAESNLWRDFVFANGSTAAADGFDIAISGLIPNAVYPVTIWSFDISSPQTRRSAWNGNAYAFDGNSADPSSLAQYSLTFEIGSDASGAAVIEARTGSPAGPSHNVFLNALEIGDPISIPTAPSDLDISATVAFKSAPVGAAVGTLATADAEVGDTFTYSLAAGEGDTHNALFGTFTTNSSPPETCPASRAARGFGAVRTTDPGSEFWRESVRYHGAGQPDSLPLRINEIMADGRNAHRDGDGEASDWVEILNPNGVPISLDGYFLTDNPSNLTKWAFPAVSVPRNGYLVIYASAPEQGGAVLGDYQDAAGNYHANFSLDAGGEFLGLVKPGGAGIAAAFEPEFPKQHGDISYGFDTGGALKYFDQPTPGAANGSGFDGVVADTEFSVDRGFYDAPFSVAITTATPEAEIRYTLDGRKPTPTMGTIYSGEIAVSTTATLRAIAYRPGWIPTDADTQTYLFADDVARQPASPPGWPDNWGTNSEVNSNDGAGNGTVPADYEMDPRVADNTLPGYSIRDALLDIPSVSIVMDRDEFIAPGSGIYAIPQSRIEKECSMEYILPDGSPGFQEDCKIEVHGNSSRRPWRMQKHSLRVTFSSGVGPAKLDYPLFTESPVRGFNKLVLRACFTDSWGLVSWDTARYRPNDSQYFRDVWMKESLRDMGQPSSYGNFVHLYVDGLYFGLHNLTERLEDDFFAAHLGGEKADWEINEDFASPGPRWTQMMAIDASSAAGYTEIQGYLDIDNFIDYMILHLYADSEDWPHHNGYAAANETSGDGKFRFFAWDQEIVLDKFTWNRYGDSRGAGQLFQKLRANAGFRLRFADRVRLHLFNGGALSLGESQARYLEVAGWIDKAIVAESARWGDTQASTPYGNTPGQPSPLDNLDHDNYPSAPHSPIYFTREDSWLVERDNVVDHYLPTIHDEGSAFGFIPELRAADLYPSIDAPALSPHGGVAAPGTPVGISAPQGTIYYTTDGSDPMGEAGIIYSGEIPLAETGRVKARALSGGEWSAVTEAFYIVGTPASPENLAVTEIMYNPDGTDEAEFLELANISAGSIDLTGVHFAAGIDFAFPDGFTLDAGERAVLARSAAGFEAAYPGVPLAGEFQGLTALDNGGETIAIVGADGGEIRSFRYNDRAPWPEVADGGGPSLVLIAPETNPDHGDPANWRLSALPGGAPGAGDAAPFSGDPLADDDGDSLAAIAEYYLGTSDADPASGAGSVAATIEAFPNAEPPGRYVVFRFRRDLAADDAVAEAQISREMEVWQSGADHLVFAASIYHGDGTETLAYRSVQPASGGAQFGRLRVWRR